MLTLSGRIFQILAATGKHWLPRVDSLKEDTARWCACLPIPACQLLPLQTPRKGDKWRDGMTLYAVYSQNSTWLVTSHHVTSRHNTFDVSSASWRACRARRARTNPVFSRQMTWRDEPSGIWAYNSSFRRIQQRDVALWLKRTITSPMSSRRLIAALFPLTCCCQRRQIINYSSSSYKQVLVLQWLLLLISSNYLESAITRNLFLFRVTGAWQIIVWLRRRW